MKTLTKNLRTFQKADSRNRIQYLAYLNDDWERVLVEGIVTGPEPAHIARNIPDEALRRESMYQDRGV